MPPSGSSRLIARALNWWTGTCSVAPAWSYSATPRGSSMTIGSDSRGRSPRANASRATINGNSGKRDALNKPTREPTRWLLLVGHPQVWAILATTGR